VFKKTKIIIYIVLLALFLRLVFLDRIPTGISNDEYYFVLNAKSVFYNFLILITKGWNNEVFHEILNSINSETSILLMALFMGILPSSMFFIRLPYVIVGVLTIYLIYKITQKYTKNINLALLTALLFAINPWSIYVNRTSFDAPVALFFFVLTIYLQSFPKRWYIVFSALTSFFAFNGYIGTKVIYLPFMLFVSFYSWKIIHHKKFTKLFIFNILFAVTITVQFLLNLSGSSISNRKSELALPSSDSIITEVISERNQSLVTPFNTIFTNRYTIYARNFTNKYLYNFSTDILFLDGDHTFMISLWKMGYFYYIDIFLLIFGLIYLFNHHRSFFYLLSLLIMLSPIPESIRIDKLPSYAFHSSFQYPFLMIVLGAGTFHFWQLAKSKILKFLFVFIYSILFINFIDIYFNKYPIYQPEGFFISRRLVSNYVKHEQANMTPIYIATNEPESLFRNYLFFTNQYNYKNFSLIKNQYLLHPEKRFFQWGSITISDKLPEKTQENTTYILDSEISTTSLSTDKYFSIYHLGDKRDLYKIYFGKTCIEKSSKENLPLTINDLRAESLTKNEFCQKFVSIR